MIVINFVLAILKKIKKESNVQREYSYDIQFFIKKLGHLKFEIKLKKKQNDLYLFFNKRNSSF